MSKAQDQTILDAHPEGAPASEDVGAKFRLIRPSTALAAMALIVLCLVVYLPGFFSIPPVDRDESRFAQASRQMFESVALVPAERTAFHDGGLVIPKIQDRPRLNKPPLIYWLQAGSAALFTAGNPYHDAIWMYRIPSLLAAIASVLFTWRLGASMFDARTGWLAAALLAVCPVVVWEAHQARADMLLLGCTTLTMWVLWEVIRSSKSPERKLGVSLRWPLLFWLALSAGVMTKGPITPMVAALAALAFSISARRWRWLLSLRFELGIPILLFCTVPWVYAVAHRLGGLDRYLAIINDEVIGRSLAGKEGHWAPPGYHTILLPVLFWPGSLMTAAGLALAWRATRAARSETRATGFTGSAGKPVLDGSSRDHSSHADPYTFALSWIAPSWLIFELVSTKLPHYTLPLYPALALLSARALLVAQAKLLPSAHSRIAVVGHVIWLLIGAVVAFGVTLQFAVFFILCTKFSIEDRRFDPLILLLLLLTLVSAGALWLIWRARRQLPRDRWVRAQIYACAAAMLLYLAWLPSIGPRVTPGAITPVLTDGIRRLPDWSTRPIGSVYHEDSLIYGLRGRVERIEASDAQKWLAEHPTGVAIVPFGAEWAKDRERFLEVASMPWTLLDDAVPIFKAITNAAPEAPLR